MQKMPHANPRRRAAFEQPLNVRDQFTPIVFCALAMTTGRASCSNLSVSKRLCGSIYLCLIAIVSIFIGSAARAEEAAAPPAIENLRIGFGNTYKLGCWTPIEVLLSQPPGQGRGAQIQVADGDGVPARYPVSQGTSAGRRILSYVKVGRADAPVEILLRKDGSDQIDLQLAASRLDGERPRAIPATNEFIVELGASIGFSSQNRSSSEGDSDAGRRVAVTLDRPQRLPDQWYGYEGVDMVVIAGTPEVQHFFTNPKTVAALEHWVRLGGKLMIASSAECESLLTPGKPLHRFAPGEFVRMTPLSPRGIANIESKAGAEGAGEQLGAGRLQFPEWRDVQGLVELSGFAARSTDFPLVVARPLGFGQVIYIGLDLHDEPFAEWPRRSQFVESFVSRRSQVAGRTAAKFDASRGRSLGLVDLSGQLRGALDQFDDVQLVPFWAVATLALAYIGLLFPLNYWLAKRWRNRPQLAWVMFALTAAVFSAGAYGIASKAKGDRLRVNQIDLVDIDAESKLVRGTTWFNVFSPKNERFDLKVLPEAGTATSSHGTKPTDRQIPDTQKLDTQTPDTVSLLSWLGLPGSGLGGLNSRAAVAPLFDEPYEIGAGQGSVSGAPLGVWSSKAFVSRWQSTSAAIRSDLSESGGRLRGAVSNPLETKLSECILLFGNSAWPIGTLAPGEEKRVEDLDPQSVIRIENHLTKKQLSSMKEQILPYDRAGFDPARIIEVMMFHEAAGGTNYTGLLHRHQRYTDLSEQLDFGKAILVGRAETGSVIEINGQGAPAESINRHNTIFRLLLPVQPVSQRR